MSHRYWWLSFQLYVASWNNYVEYFFPFKWFILNDNTINSNQTCVLRKFKIFLIERNNWFDWWQLVARHTTETRTVRSKARCVERLIVHAKNKLVQHLKAVINGTKDNAMSELYIPMWYRCDKCLLINQTRENEEKRAHCATRITCCTGRSEPVCAPVAFRNLGQNSGLIYFPP